MKIISVCDMLVHAFFNLCVLRTLLSNNPNVILRVMCSIHSSAVSKQPEDRCILSFYQQRRLESHGAEELQSVK